MNNSVPEEALKVQSQLDELLRHNDDESLKKALEGLNICINMVKQIASTRHKEQLLPQAIQKAVRAIENFSAKA